MATPVMTITVRGVDYRIAPGNIPMQEKLIVRKATGLPLESFSLEGQVGEDTIAVFWWLARRAEGEVGLTFTQAMNEWPTDLTADDLSVSVDDPSGEDPEA